MREWQRKEGEWRGLHKCVEWQLEEQGGIGEECARVGVRVSFERGSRGGGVERMECVKKRGAEVMEEQLEEGMDEPNLSLVSEE